MELVQVMCDTVSRSLFLNPSTLSGSIDVIVVRQPDGSVRCTPFHVRFGKLQLLYSSAKPVSLTVNNEPVPFEMKLGPAGEAFFVTEEPLEPHTFANDEDFDINESQIRLSQSQEMTPISIPRVLPRRSALAHSLPSHDILLEFPSTEEEQDEDILPGFSEEDEDDEGGIPFIADDTSDEEHHIKDISIVKGPLFGKSETIDKLRKKSLLSSSVEVSNCASLLFDCKDMSEEKANRIFDEHLITHELLSIDTNLLSDTSKLAVRINKKIFPWSIAYPAIMSAVLFDKPLQKETVQQLEKEELATEDNKRTWMSWLYPSRWRRNSTVNLEEELLPSDDTTKSASLPRAGLPYPSGSNSGLISRSKEIPHVPIRSNSSPKILEEQVSRRPSAKQLEEMNLQAGANSITFSVETELRGTQTLTASIFLWEHDAKIIVSDIDGTITRSDVFGHVLPMVGRDWSHSGVAKLFTLIKSNGYHIIYLTSRAIGQAQVTRNFINNLRQEDTFLPKGPVFSSPDRLFWAFNREIIRRKPEEFKIACLKNIASIFPSNPFYAGFGNRLTDVVAYEAAGVPPGRVYVIDPSGNITTLNKTYRKTYHNMVSLIDEMYPPIRKSSSGEKAGDVNDWSYWKFPPPPLGDI